MKEMLLTKTHFLSFLDSPLHLWARVFDPTSVKAISEYNQHLIEQGYQVEALAKEFLQQKVAREYPPGSTISFETTLVDGEYQTRLDALVHDVVHNTYDIYEIKSSTSAKKDYLLDVTYQHLIAKTQLPIHKTYLVYCNKTFQKTGPIDLQQFFVIDDMMAQIEKYQDEVYEKRSDALSILKLATKPADDHCFNPKECPCPIHCFPALPDYSIYDLPRATKKVYRALIDQNIEKLVDIPDTIKLSHTQKLLVQSARIQKPIIDHQKIQHDLNQLQFPLYFLDYETYGPTIPMHDGYSPYQAITFQYSLHVLRHPEDTTLEHYEYLATNPLDPCPDLANHLLSHLGDTGSIIVWNKSFECGRNTEMGQLCPDIEQAMIAINDRVYDLMEIFQYGLYMDYRFRGSYSIKKVLPILVPELSYKELPIGEGTTAMTKWFEMVYGEMSEEEKREVKVNLLRYCEMDTWAMVEIWRVMRNLFIK